MKFIKQALLSFAVVGIGISVSHAQVKDRNEIPEKYKWDFSLIYPSWEAWEADLQRCEELTDEIAALKGTLAESSENFLKMEQLTDEIGRISYKLYGYSGLQRDTDQSNNELLSRFGQFMGAMQQIDQKFSWIQPEILSIPEETVMGWVDTIPELEQYRFPLSETYRLQKHVLNAEGEQLLSYFGSATSKANQLFGDISNADAKPVNIKLSDGSDFKVTVGSYGKALTTMPNATDRRLIQKTRTQRIIDLKNTYASIYDAVCKTGWAYAQARKYDTVLQSELEGDNVPSEVYTNLIETAKKTKDTLIRYHHLRQRVLGLENYGWSDCFVPLVQDDTKYPFDDVIKEALKSVAPLGKDYQEKYAKLLNNRQIDVYENVGKRTGAYSSGIYGIGPFVLLNHQDTMESAFTIAHELGHSMHTVLSHENQPFATASYTIFVAEVASTFNEKLFLKNLLKDAISREQKIALLEHQIQDITGTFIGQSMFAEYELKAHTLVESGETLTAEKLTNIWKEVVHEFYGDVISDDDPYMYSWARIPHFFNSPYYVYKYATCYASSSTLYKEMTEAPTEEARQEVVNRHLTLLKSGGNDYPIRQLQKAGVDLTTPEPTENVVKELDRLVTELEGYYPEYSETNKI
jgi:oligoendopeptidase F